MDLGGREHTRVLRYIVSCHSNIVRFVEERGVVSVH